MTITHQTLAGYQAAREAAAFHRVPDPGQLVIRGADRVAFIQRQTTNNVERLKPDQAVLTVLTSPTARILDVWRLLPQTDIIGVITLPGHGPTTAQHLQGRIFFMDQVTVEDVSARYAHFELVGPQAGHVLKRLGFKQPPAPGDVAYDAPDGVRVMAVGLTGLIGRGHLLTAPVDEAPALVEQLTGLGAETLSPAAYEVLRVEDGLPAAGHELTDDFTPLEANLDAAISDAKGCYTGQEVIARQITYDKITRRLAGLRLAEPVAPGATVRADGRRAGTVTSAVESPGLGPVALAVLKRPHHAPGTAVSVESGDGTLVAGEVVALPFKAE